MSSAKKLPVWQQVSLGLVLGSALIAWMSSQEDVPELPTTSTSAKVPETLGGAEANPAARPADTAATSQIDNASKIQLADAQGAMDPVPVRLLSGGRGIGACTSPDRVYDMDRKLSDFNSGSVERDELIKASAELDCLALPSDSTGTAIAFDANGMMLVQLADLANLEGAADMGEGLELWIDAKFLRHRQSEQQMLEVWRALRDQ